MIKSSLENLIALLVKECSQRPELNHVSEDTVRGIVNTLEGEIFSEDNMKKSTELLEKIIDPIVEKIYREEKI